jgi:hypothetical protein
MSQTLYESPHESDNHDHIKSFLLIRSAFPKMTFPESKLY